MQQFVLTFRNWKKRYPNIWAYSEQSYHINNIRQKHINRIKCFNKKESSKTVFFLNIYLHVFNTNVISKYLLYFEHDNLLDLHTFHAYWYIYSELFKVKIKTQDMFIPYLTGQCQKMMDLFHRVMTSIYRLFTSWRNDHRFIYTMFSNELKSRSIKKIELFSH